MANVRNLLAQADALLASRVEAPRLEAQILLAHVLQRDRSWLYAWPEHAPDAAQISAFEALVAQRLQGRPIAHLTGEREFWSLPLHVSRDTLIPRPETEHLVEIALGLGLATTAQVLDLGCGSGAIALALASERPHWQIVAAERSPAALDIARANAVRLGVPHLTLLLSDWFSAIDPAARFDLIVSNPPYVAEGDPHLGRDDLRFEPRAALAAGRDGLDDIRHITARAGAYLKPGGWLWLEHGSTQGGPVGALLAQHGFEHIRLHRDLAGHERHSGGRKAADPSA